MAPGPATPAKIASYALLFAGLARFRRPVRDYFAICDSYFKAVRSDSPHGLETVDVARRAVHDEAAELLIECLDGQIEMDFACKATSRARPAMATAPANIWASAA